MPVLPLDGARLKVVRAQEHLDVLKSEIRYYAHTHPYEIVAEPRDKIWHIEVTITSPPPPRLSLIIGDCVGNLRAALDHITWQLAARYAGRRLVVGKDTIYVPLCDEPSRYGKSAKRFAEAYTIPTDALTHMEAVQPYQAGYELLRLLRAVTNQDKHRLLLLTTGRALDGDLEIWPEGYPSPFRVQGTSAAFLETTIPMSGDTEPALVHRDVKVKGQATIYVALKDFAMPYAWGPVDGVLEQAVKCVADIVPRFDSFV